MTSEKLLYALTDLDEKWVKEAEKAYKKGILPAQGGIFVQKNDSEQKNAPLRGMREYRNYAKYLATAACIAMIGGIGWYACRHYLPAGAPFQQGGQEITDLASQQNGQENTDSSSRQNGQEPAGVPSQREEPTEKEINSGTAEEPFVEVAALLADNSGNVTELAMHMDGISIGGYRALYENAPAVSKEVLRESRGASLEGNEGWYLVSGHRDFQYLIHDSGEEATLWKFGYFQSEEYPYKEVLETVYGIRSSDDILSVSAVAVQIDNTDAGKKVQAEVGKQVITDREDIRQLYEVLCGMTCYGSDRWDLIDTGAADDSRKKMLQAVRFSRDLTIELADGNRVDSLNYTGIGGMFYEFGGIAYNPLSEAERETVDKIFGIEQYGKELIERSGEDVQTDTQTNTQTDVTGQKNGTAGTVIGTETEGMEIESSLATEDIPVDESTYHEAHRYADEVEEVQYAISQAMMAGELPYVTESAIRENPVRVEVKVNTQDEALLKKLKAFDPSGDILKIVYSEGGFAIQDYAKEKYTKSSYAIPE